MPETRNQLAYIGWGPHGGDEGRTWLDTDRHSRTRLVARLLPPESSPVEVVSSKVGISVATLERWRAEAWPAPRRERGLDRRGAA